MAAGDIILREDWTGTTPFLPIVDSPASWNPNVTTSLIGSPALWGPEMLRVDHSVGARAFGQLNIGTTSRDVTAVLEFLITSSSITTSGVNNIFSVKHDSTGSNELIGRFQLQNNSGNTQLFCFVRYDGTDQIVAFPTLNLSQKYRLEFQWNITTAAWGVWLDNSALASGSITSIALSQFTLTDVQPGGAAIDTADGTHFMGPVVLYEGPRIAGMYDAVFTQGCWVRRPSARVPREHTVATRKATGFSGRLSTTDP